MKAREAVQKVMDAGVKPDESVRVTRRMEIGSVDRQGDVYVARVADDHPRGTETGVRQVAVGSTVGARHVTAGRVKVYEGRQLPDFVKPYRDVPPDAYLGPVVVADEPWMLTHPEHADHQLPAGTFQVTYQVDPVEARRVLD